MNKYAKKAAKENFLSGTADASLPTKQRVGKAAAQTGIMLLAGLGGGFVGAGTGRWSLLTGLLVAGTGQFTGTPAVTAFGLGMATSNVFSADQSVSGTDEKDKKKPMALAKERMKNYAQGLKQKLFLDKILTPKKKEEEKSTTTTTTTTETTDSGTAGMGEVTYMKYPLNAENMDVMEMEKYERELEKSAQKYMQSQDTKTVSGTDGLMDDERLY